MRQTRAVEFTKHKAVTTKEGGEYEREAGAQQQEAGLIEELLCCSGARNPSTCEGYLGDERAQGTLGPHYLVLDLRRKEPLALLTSSSISIPAWRRGELEKR